MDVATRNRLPGVYFEVESPSPSEVLPRMDIAAFVGFAASGPLDTPVPVEDIVQYRDIFGPDLPLAWDTETGRMQHAHLGSAVEAFFHNGGGRCWVMRVAGEAETNLFTLPGLVRADNQLPAIAQARCAGSWSDLLRVSTVLLRQGLEVASIQYAPHDYLLDFVATPDQVRRGDLLELTFCDETLLAPCDAGLLLYLVVDSVEEAAFAQAAGRTYPTQRIRARQGFWFEFRVPPATGETMSPPLTSPPASGPGTEGSRELQPIGESEGLTSVQSWQMAASPPGNKQPFAALLNFELWVWRDQELQARMGGLAFGSDHPRFWGHLPTDECLFHLSDLEPLPADSWPLEQEAASPRFPLSGPEKPAAVYLPLGMPGVPDPASSHGALGDPLSGTRLERDGLAQFSADLFLDRDLGASSRSTLMADARRKYYVQRKALHGVHSLFPLNEVTLVSVPDAVQPGWREIAAAAPVPLAAPTLAPVPQPDETGAYDLSWSPAGGATRYLLQEADDPTFARPIVRFEGHATVARLSAQASCPRHYSYRVRAVRGNQVSPWSNTEEVVIPQPDFEGCLAAATRLGPLSLDSPIQEGDVLHWSAAANATGYTLQEATDPAFDTAETIYIGSERHFPIAGWPDRVTFYRVRADRDGRAGAWSNTAWYVPNPQLAWRMEQPGEYRAGDLLAVQRALLRLCAARGDVLALLALPNHYREEDALAHAAALTSRVEESAATHAASGFVQVKPIPPDEGHTLSFGALYHPWIATRVESSQGTTSVQFVPPTGAVCGTVSTRAISRGAWVAPANVPITGVVSLDPEVDVDGWAGLYQAQVNVVRQDPRGFLLLSADTLSPESAWRPINVRRLMILLRRLALREGATYVFQPNDTILHRLVQHKFERLLADLFARGAFAGDSPEVSYRVTTDSSVNTPVSVEQGRFIVEVRVAPSQPLAFLTVRLIQTDQEGLTVQEL